MSIQKSGKTAPYRTMDITNFVVQGRDKALLYGDFSTYHGQLSKRLLNSRKKLGIVTRNRGKFRKPEQVTAEDVQGNIEYDIIRHRRSKQLTELAANVLLPDMSTSSSSPANAPGLRQ